MKRTIAACIAAIFLLTSCGQTLVHTMPGGMTVSYGTVGLFTLDKRSKYVCYGVSVGNVIWSILLIESVVFPVYFIGWSILNPERMKRSADDDCSEP